MQHFLNGYGPDDICESSRSPRYTVLISALSENGEDAIRADASAEGKTVLMFPREGTSAAAPDGIDQRDPRSSGSGQPATPPPNRAGRCRPDRILPDAPTRLFPDPESTISSNSDCIFCQRARRGSYRSVRTHLVEQPGAPRVRMFAMHGGGPRRRPLRRSARR